MNNPDTNLLFPMRVIPSLGDLRGEAWQQLVARVADKREEDEEKIAFSALIIKIAGCVGCSADSFRALRGCTQCASLVVKRYKGTDEDLLQSYQDSRREVSNALEKRRSNLSRLDN